MITCAHTMRKNTVSCLHTIRKNKDDLVITTYKFKMQYSGNSSDIHNGVGDRYHIALTDIVPQQGCPTRRYESTALCDLIAILKLQIQITKPVLTLETFVVIQELPPVLLQLPDHLPLYWVFYGREDCGSHEQVQQVD